jgi:glycopeptide antibiotics resistance protein
MKQNTAKILGSILSGIVLGYLLYYFVFMEIASVFFGGGIFYIAISVLGLFLCIAGCSVVIYMFLAKKVKRSLLWLIAIAYLCALLITLFGRPATTRVFIWNPLDAIRDLTSVDMLLASIMNLVIFIPVGLFFRNLSPRIAFLGCILIPITVEFVQVLTMRGMFDTFDIFLYFVGLGVGTLVFKRWKIELVE